MPKKIVLPKDFKQKVINTLSGNVSPHLEPDIKNLLENDLPATVIEFIKKEANQGRITITTEEIVDILEFIKLNSCEGSITITALSTGGFINISAAEILNLIDQQETDTISFISELKILAQYKMKLINLLNEYNQIITNQKLEEKRDLARS